jgi:exosortase D (VPLPA-CTERM-specific)
MLLVKKSQLKNTSIFLQKNDKFGRILEVLLFLGTILILILTFHDAFRQLINEWQREEYSHGFLIPLVAILIGLHRLSRNPPKVSPSWKGVFVILASLSLALFGEHAAARHLVLLGIWGGLLGLVYAHIGKRAVHILIPPFIYLFFCFPAPTELYNNLSLYLQLLSSFLGTELLEVIGIPVYRDGNIIDLGIYKLQVVEACNGLRYLFPLMSFSMLVAYLMQDSLWKRIVVFLSAIPLAITMNVFRIAITGVIVNYWGPEMAEGFIHEFQGYTIFAISIAILLGEVWVLMHIGKKGSLDLEIFSIPHAPFWQGKILPRAPGITYALILLIAFSYSLKGGFAEKHLTVPTQESLNTIPVSLGEWYGDRILLDADTLNALKLTEYTNITYSSPAYFVPVNLYISYLASQRMGVIIHPPTNCLPGSGWKIENKEVISLPEIDPELKLVRLLVQSGQEKMLVYFWYEQQGQKVTNQLESRLRLMLNSLLYNRTDGALVRFSTYVLNSETETEAEKRILDIMSQAMPYIEEGLPEEAGAQ